MLEWVGNAPYLLSYTKLTYTLPSKLMRTYIWEHECPNCDAPTLHECYDDPHERDSSGSWRECTVCKWRWSGLSDEYHPPSADWSDSTDSPPPSPPLRTDP